ncbi:MAG: DEAD/DEAH box helicase [Bacillota bacterium]|nr:DEAD/DEAH box helicase [Bacillota bacterium]
MNLAQLLEEVDADPAIRASVTAWVRTPPREAEWRDWPEESPAGLRRALERRGVRRLYSHQLAAWEAARQGRNPVVVTPTASGKTLCYNLPVLERLLAEPEARALYLFPTKALAQDQRAELSALLEALGEGFLADTYDGDTPPERRRAIRAAARIVITNPDMLHAAILPHHTQWQKLFQGLRFVVIDELHQYRGVFGSHVAGVLRRLERIARFYGSSPQVIATSATIGNPAELARRLTGRAAVAIRENGAPQGEKHFLFYNPPLVDPSSGIRRSSLAEAEAWAARFLRHAVPTILFGRSRLSVELMLSELRRKLPPALASRVEGYRGGYLPGERRRIERGLRSGQILGVASTNALELGVDIGSLSASVMAGYPGSVASTWQEAGRAGRRQEPAVAVLVAGGAPLDQYVVTHPEYFLSKEPEEARINPENLYILMSHVQCAAFELPFRDGERWPGLEGEEVDLEAILEFLAQEGVLRHTGGRWYWNAESFPANEISLRSAAQENVVIVDTSRGARVIGEVDLFSAPLLVHEQAIYLHGGRQYEVTRLDFAERKAYVRPVEVDYYTDADLAVELRVTEVERQEVLPGGWQRAWGEVRVVSRATIFKKIRFTTRENVGWGQIHLPELEMPSTAFWFSLPPESGALWPQAVLEGGLLGLGRLLAGVAPLYLLCDAHDLRSSIQARSPFTGRPTVFLYESYPGGVGLSEKLYSLHRELLRAAFELVEGCPCANGCPGCVGPASEVGPRGKEVARALLAAALAGAGAEPGEVRPYGAS